MVHRGSVSQENLNLAGVRTAFEFSVRRLGMSDGNRSVIHVTLQCKRTRIERRSPVQSCSRIGQAGNRLAEFAREDVAGSENVHSGRETLQFGCLLALSRHSHVAAFRIGRNSSQ